MNYADEIVRKLRAERENDIIEAQADALMWAAERYGRPDRNGVEQVTVRELLDAAADIQHRRVTIQ